MDTRPPDTNDEEEKPVPEDTQDGSRITHELAAPTPTKALNVSSLDSRIKTLEDQIQHKKPAILEALVEEEAAYIPDARRDAGEGSPLANWVEVVELPLPVLKLPPDKLLAISEDGTLAFPVQVVSNITKDDSEPNGSSQDFATVPAYQQIDTTLNISRPKVARSRSRSISPTKTSRASLRPQFDGPTESRSLGRASGMTVPQAIKNRSRAGSLTARDERSSIISDRPPPIVRTHLPHTLSRAQSTPVIRRAKSSYRGAPGVLTNTNFDGTPVATAVVQTQNLLSATKDDTPVSAKETITTTALSFHDYLYLSLAPTPSSKQDLASAELRIEKLVNFLTLPGHLETVMWFGAFACLDGWLWNFTILPLRCVGAVWVLILHWMKLLGEIGASFAKAWVRPDTLHEAKAAEKAGEAPQTAEKRRNRFRYLSNNRKKSDLLPSHKADLLKGAVIFCSCWVLLGFDSSRMYHGIRGQSAIKLYVIFNVLEVADKLCSAVGQDIFECLFSRESLERRPDGTSKVLRPFGFFLLALGYNILHATVLFYQVITLNVAVNSYSNALLTLLMSNQFVEIKSTVFKRFEKENLFQITCADIVERFQLWMMLLIIASRNLVEIGLEGFLGVDGFGLSGLVMGFTKHQMNSNTITTFSTGGTILPKSFTVLSIFPRWTGQVMGPFALVLGSEMLVDWLKHAYITKFNNINPKIYARFLDVLAKDYYNNAFVDENLTKRLGLPVMPLACLFIRSSLQTYNMFIATQDIPTPLPSAETALSQPTSSPAITAALHRFDTLLRRAFLGTTPLFSTSQPSADSIIALFTVVFFFFAVWLVFLVAKLVLGILLLGYSRRRYRGMKEREKANYDVLGRKAMGWVEVDDEQRRRIFEGDKEGEKAAIQRDRAKPKEIVPLGEVSRYAMVAKRIW